VARTSSPRGRWRHPPLFNALPLVAFSSCPRPPRPPHHALLPSSPSILFSQSPSIPLEPLFLPLSRPPIALPALPAPFALPLLLHLPLRRSRSSHLLFPSHLHNGQPFQWRSPHGDFPLHLRIGWRGAPGQDCVSGPQRLPPFSAGSHHHRDQVSDAVLDACMAQDPLSKVLFISRPVPQLWRRRQSN
jgi:hypothetical protein